MLLLVPALVIYSFTSNSVSFIYSRPYYDQQHVLRTVRSYRSGIVLGSTPMLEAPNLPSSPRNEQ